VTRGYTLDMTLDTLIMLSGAFVATLPFLGFPNSWDAALFFIAGAFVIGLGIVVRRRGGSLGVSASSRETRYVEHQPSQADMSLSETSHGQS
jgi:hypothetical protein